jgi:8-oxo-dGTP pyrophosphatase MutT (NUDIX family)/phosphohistidine phosphatase SixA
VARRSPEPTVRAAGGVVWRVHNGKVEVALIHRPRYDDWSFPKGKLDEGETELQAAVREVEEELGCKVAVSRRIGEVRYEIAGGLKYVTYWVMRRTEGRFTPTDEVDDAQWLRPKAARSELTYDFDRRVLADFTSVPTPDSMIVLVRHARAGKRAEWRGTDRNRPLEPMGEAQAAKLATLLELFGPDGIVSADLERCVETVRPLAKRVGLPVQIDPVFSDESFERNPDATEDAILALAKPGKVTVVCSQGVAVPGLIDRLGRGVRDSATKKGTFWALSLVDGSVVSIDYYDDALRI